MDSSNSITLQELIDKEEELEQEAYEKLKEPQWGDETRCTFSDGAISQPVYSCLTCSKQGGEEGEGWVGVCFGCSMNCHVDHEIVELFDKRDFRYYLFLSFLFLFLFLFLSFFLFLFLSFSLLPSP